MVIGDHGLARGAPLKGERMALKQRSDIVAEHRVSIIGFVWRPEEIIPSVIQMAHRAAPASGGR